MSNQPCALKHEPYMCTEIHSSTNSPDQPGDGITTELDVLLEIVTQPPSIFFLSFTFPFACIQNDKLSLPSLSPFCDELFDETISAGQKYYGFLLNFDVDFLAFLFTWKPRMDGGDKGKCRIVQAWN